MELDKHDCQLTRCALCWASISFRVNSYSQSAGMDYRCVLYARKAFPSHTLTWRFGDTGTDLLDLPQEVLHAIFSHIKAHEWAQGPAQSCRLLSKMDLPRLALHLPVRSFSCGCHLPGLGPSRADALLQRGGSLLITD